jgi:hypothetical protein
MNIKWLLPVLLLAPACLHAGDKKKWDIENPGGPQKEVSFTVNEGTLRMVLPPCTTLQPTANSYSHKAKW